jgi:hypothetical protein
MERHHGEDVVFVKWNGDNEVDQVRQQNVSGTGPPPEYQSNRRRR